MPTVDIPPVRLPSIEALSDPDALASGGRRTLVLKRTATTLNWVARRSGDAVGREAALTRCLLRRRAPCQRPRRRLRRSSADAAARRRQGRQLRAVAGQTGSRIRLAVARRRTGHTGPRLVSGRQLRSARPPQGARHRALPRPPRISPDASTFEPALGAYGVCRRPVWRADAAVGKGAQPAGARIAARCRGVELVGHPAQAPRVIISDASPHPAEWRDEERNIQ
jgi:hypothetical protein